MDDVNNIKLLIGKRIKELRLKHKFKQAELAEKVGIGPKHQSCIETGKNFPSSELFENYAEVFNIKLDELLNIKPSFSEKSRKEIIENIITNIKTASDYELGIISKMVAAFFVKNIK